MYKVIRKYGFLKVGQIIPPDYAPKEQMEMLLRKGVIEPENPVTAIRRRRRKK